SQPAAVHCDMGVGTTSRGGAKSRRKTALTPSASPRLRVRQLLGAQQLQLGISPNIGPPRRKRPRSPQRRIADVEIQQTARDSHLEPVRDLGIVQLFRSPARIRRLRRKPNLPRLQIDDRPLDAIRPASPRRYAIVA